MDTRYRSIDFDVGRILTAIGLYRVAVAMAAKIRADVGVCVSFKLRRNNTPCACDADNIWTLYYKRAKRPKWEIADQGSKSTKTILGFLVKAIEMELSK